MMVSYSQCFYHFQTRPHIDIFCYFSQEIHPIHEWFQSPNLSLFYALTKQGRRQGMLCVVISWIYQQNTSHTIIIPTHMLSAIQKLQIYISRIWLAQPRRLCYNWEGTDKKAPRRLQEEREENISRLIIPVKKGF